jgi:hypothetical protein
MVKSKAITKNLDGAELQVGDIISRQSYYMITSTDLIGGKTSITNIKDDGRISIDTDILTREGFSASQVTETIKCSKTNVAEAMITSGGKVFTVNYVSKSKGDRTLVGHFISTEPMFGRSRVYDLEAKDFRLVDHRTIKSLVCGSTEYIANK